MVLIFNMFNYSAVSSATTSVGSSPAFFFLLIVALAGFIFGLPLSMSQDTQVIVVAICIASDLNIFSNMGGKRG